MRIKPLYLIILVSLIAGTFIYLLLSRNEVKPNNTQKETQVLPIENDGELKLTTDNKTLELQAESYEWKVSNEQNVAVSFKTLPSPPPAAITLKIRFDPNVLKVEKVEPGNLWQQANVLKTQIDNTEGYVEYSLGQGFDSKATNNSTIANLVITPIQLTDSRTSIEITTDSVMAFVGVRELVSMESSSIDINLSQ